MMFGNPRKVYKTWTKLVFRNNFTPTFFSGLKFCVIRDVCIGTRSVLIYAWERFHGISSSFLMQLNLVETCQYRFDETWLWVLTRYWMTLYLLIVHGACKHWHFGEYGAGAFLCYWCYCGCWVTSRPKLAHHFNVTDDVWYVMMSPLSAARQLSQKFSISNIISSNLVK